MPATRENPVYLVDQIKIPERMRQEFTAQDHTKLSALENSIRIRGLLSPIIITRDLELVAGHRRLLCHIRLGLDTIECKYYDEQSAEELLLIELEENIRRLKMGWREVMLGIGRYHTQMTERKPTWTLKQSSQTLNIPLDTIKDSLTIYPFRHHQSIKTSVRLKEALTTSRRLRREQIALEILRTEVRSFAKIVSITHEHQHL
jgi:hypothetical protein